MGVNGFFEKKEINDFLGYFFLNIKIYKQFMIFYKILNPENLK